MTIREVRLNTNMTQKEFAEYFNIPKRTIENWEGEKRTPPEYVLELIKYKTKKERLGMLKLIEKNHGEVKVLKEGTVTQLVDWLKENTDIYTWISNEDTEAEMPDFEDAEILKELENELEKVDLGWWGLEIVGAKQSTIK